MGTLMKVSNGVDKNWMLPRIPSLLDDFFTRDLFSWPSDSGIAQRTMPPVNVRETENSFELELAAPGMDRKDFKIELQDNHLVISAQLENQQEEKKENYSRREFSYHSFTRSFQLPTEIVETKDINARYSNGMLYITIPKKPEAKNITREIKVH